MWSRREILAGSLAVEGRRTIIRTDRGRKYRMHPVKTECNWTEQNGRQPFAICLRTVFNTRSFTVFLKTDIRARIGNGNFFFTCTVAHTSRSVQINQHWSSSVKTVFQIVLLAPATCYKTACLFTHSSKDT